MGLAGAMRLITVWQMPTHSLARPKSLTKMIGREASAIGVQHPPRRPLMQAA